MTDMSRLISVRGRLEPIQSYENDCSTDIEENYWLKSSDC